MLCLKGAFFSKKTECFPVAICPSSMEMTPLNGSSMQVSSDREVENKADREVENKAGRAAPTALTSNQMLIYNNRIDGRHTGRAPVETNRDEFQKSLEGEKEYEDQGSCSDRRHFSPRIR